MNSLDFTRGAIDGASGAIPPGSPVFMLNLLRFRDRAEYSAGSNAGLEPCSGREAYFGRYIPAFSRLAGDLPIRPLYLGTAQAGLVVPAGESWEMVAVVEYPDFEAFRRVVDTSEYRAEALPHRLASLADWRLIATTRFEFPG